MSPRLKIVAAEFGWPQLIEEYLGHVQATLKSSTHRSYGQQLSLFARWLEAHAPDSTVQDFRATDLDAYLNFRAANDVAAITRSYDAKLVRKVLEYAYLNDHIDRRPLRDYRVRKVPAKKQRCPTVEELQQLLYAVETRWDPIKNPKVRFVRAAERKFYRVRDLAIFAGLIDLSCRINELLDLEMTNLDIETLTATFHDTKSNTDEEKTFTPRWLACVQEWRKVRPKNTDNARLFISSFGDTLTPNRMSESFRIYRDLAGLPKEIHLHSLRHYSITAVAEVSLLAAQSQAGHHDPRTTQIYTHTKQNYVREQQANADPLGKVLDGKILINNRTEAQKKAARRKLI